MVAETRSGTLASPCLSAPDPCRERRVIILRGQIAVLQRQTEAANLSWADRTVRAKENLASSYGAGLLPL